MLLAFLSADPTAVTLSAFLVDGQGGVIGRAIVPLLGVDETTFIAGPGPQIDFVTGAAGRRAINRMLFSRAGSR